MPMNSTIYGIVFNERIDMPNPSAAMFTVRGKVVGDSRPRVTARGTYFPKAQTDYKRAIMDAIEEAGLEPIGDGPVDVSILVYRKMPKSRPKSMESEPDTFKPDIDNIAKIFLDAMVQAELIGDDRQVTELAVRKFDRTRRDEDTVHVIIRKAVANG